MLALWSDPPFATSADHAACRALIRNGSKSFFAASLLLPAPIREAALALYAFCRLADDAVDLAARADSLAQLRQRVDLVYRGNPMPIAADRAFADVVTRHAIPRAIPDALLDGFDWDLQGRRFETAAELNGYAARVAGTVGAMMACLMDARSPDMAARACDLGVAMQLTNIARDVGEDARAGRLYLPLQWLREAGVDPEAWLRSPQFTVAIGSVVQRLLRSAEALYERAGSGIARLPHNCRPGIFAARFLYAEIGHELERRGLDSISRRTVVPALRKASVLARALLAGGSPQEINAAPPLEETRFLVQAVVASASTRRGSATPIAEHARARSFDDRIGWLVDLFERLERRQRLGAPRGS
jgi:phytoene synthase